MLKKALLIISLLLILCDSPAFAESMMGLAGSKSQPVIINGDTVEYSADSQEVTASGNVEIVYGGTKLTCQKLTVNTQTKDGVASGHARLEDKQGIIEGDKLVYNFQNHTGSIVDAEFRANPYFGKARNVDKESETEFTARYGFATTCSFDNPHYRLSSKEINVIPGEMIQTKDDYFYLGGFPLFYIPRFNRRFEKPLMHVSVLPGSRKDWGPYLLSVWRVNVSPNIDGRFYLDYRTKLGWAEGFGANYKTPSVGNGDFKFYYSDEHPKNPTAGTPTELQRYFMRFRHKWDIDKQTNFVTEAYKIVDEKRKKVDPESNFLKDYFYREFEKDAQPLTYALFHHNFSYSSFDLLVQKRTNHWYEQLDKLPQASYTLPNLHLGESPFYFENATTIANFNKKSTTIPVSIDDVTVSRFDTTNKLSLPMKVFFLDFTPFVKFRETVYDKGADGESLPARSIFYGGADLSTKFYRVFKLNSNFVGLDINGLRHVITPSIGYSYNPEPTVESNKLFQIDSVDSLTSSNAASLELSNKLQTKRRDAFGKEVTVDLLDFKISTSYAFAPQIVYGTNMVIQNFEEVSQTNISNRNKKGASISDILFKYKILPYSWLRIEGDARYKHSGVPTDSDYSNYNHFSNVNYDINFDFAPERSFGIGQRYERNAGNELTASFKWRFNPKWKFSIYERYNMRNYISSSDNTNVNRGSLEQEYTISRDLHCWEVDFTLNRKRNEGSTIFIVFRLKAFPENEFGINQSYNKPNSGSQ